MEVRGRDFSLSQYPIKVTRVEHTVFEDAIFKFEVMDQDGNLLAECKDTLQGMTALILADSLTDEHISDLREIMHDIEPSIDWFDVHYEKLAVVEGYMNYMRDLVTIKYELSLSPNREILLFQLMNSSWVPVTELDFIVVDSKQQSIRDYILQELFPKLEDYTGKVVGIKAIHITEDKIWEYRMLFDRGIKRTFETLMF